MLERKSRGSLERRGEDVPGVDSCGRYTSDCGQRTPTLGPGSARTRARGRTYHFLMIVVVVDKRPKSPANVEQGVVGLIVSVAATVGKFVSCRRGLPLSSINMSTTALLCVVVSSSLQIVLFSSLLASHLSCTVPHSLLVPRVPVVFAARIVRLARPVRLVLAVPFVPPANARHDHVQHNIVYIMESGTPLPRAV